jgi:hypothetical protein
MSGGATVDLGSGTGERVGWALCVGERVGRPSGLSHLTSVGPPPVNVCYLNFRRLALADESCIIFMGFSIGKRKSGSLARCRSGTLPHPTDQGS